MKDMIYMITAIFMGIIILLSPVVLNATYTTRDVIIDNKEYKECKISCSQYKTGVGSCHVTCEDGTNMYTPKITIIRKTIIGTGLLNKGHKEIIEYKKPGKEKRKNEKEGNN